MKVLLHTDIHPLGHLGDVVTVNDGYARNYLLPQRLAVEPTEANIQAIAEEKTRQGEVRRLALAELVAAAEKVNEAQVAIHARANEQGHLFGSVAETDIAAALQQQGFSVQAKHVNLDEHFRQLGSYDVKLKFAPDIHAAVQVAVVRPEGEEGDAQPEPAQQPEQPE